MDTHPTPAPSQSTTVTTTARTARTRTTANTDHQAVVQDVEVVEAEVGVVTMLKHGDVGRRKSGACVPPGVPSELPEQRGTGREDEDGACLATTDAGADAGSLTSSVSDAAPDGSDHSGERDSSYTWTSGGQHVCQAVTGHTAKQPSELDVKEGDFILLLQTHGVVERAVPAAAAGIAVTAFHSGDEDAGMDVANWLSGQIGVRIGLFPRSCAAKIAGYSQNLHITAKDLNLLPAIIINYWVENFPAKQYTPVQHEHRLPEKIASEIFTWEDGLGVATGVATHVSRARQSFLNARLRRSRGAKVEPSDQTTSTSTSSAVVSVSLPTLAPTLGTLSEANEEGAGGASSSSGSSGSSGNARASAVASVIVEAVSTTSKSTFTGNTGSAARGRDRGAAQLPSDSAQRTTGSMACGNGGGTLSGVSAANATDMLRRARHKLRLATFSNRVRVWSNTKFDNVTTGFLLAKQKLHVQMHKVLTWQVRPLCPLHVSSLYPTVLLIGRFQLTGVFFYPKIVHRCKR